MGCGADCDGIEIDEGGIGTPVVPGIGSSTPFPLALGALGPGPLGMIGRCEAGICKTPVGIVGRDDMTV